MHSKKVNGEKGPDIKCCAVSWSCRGRYAIASFSKKLSRSTEDNEVIRGNIQVYDLHQNKRTYKFENTYGMFNIKRSLLNALQR